MAAATARVARREADVCPSALVVSEFRLPDMTALDLMERLRQRGQAVSLLLVMAAISPEVRQASQRVPACLLKPYEIDAVLEALGWLLSPTATPRALPSPLLRSRIYLHRAATAWEDADDE